MTDTSTLNAGAGDCWVGASRDAINTTGTVLYIGQGGADPQETRRAWLPFATCPVPPGSTISSATFKMVAAGAGPGSSAIKIGFEDADNPSDPTVSSDLRGRALTTAVTTASLGTWSTGTQYSYNVKTAFEELIARAGWAANNKAAVMIDDNGSAYDGWRAVAAYENTSYAEGSLVIEYIPPGGGQVIIWESD